MSSSRCTSSTTPKFDVLLSHTDFEEVCQQFGISEPVLINDVQKIFPSLLSTLFHKLLSQWETDKQILSKFWTSTYQQPFQSQYHCNRWLETLKQQNTDHNQQYKMKQCVVAFNQCIVVSAANNLARIIDKRSTDHMASRSVTAPSIYHKTHDHVSKSVPTPLPCNMNQAHSDMHNEKEEQLPIGWVLLTDADGECSYYNMLSGQTLREMPTDGDEPMPELKKSSAALLTPSTTNHVKAYSLQLPDKADIDSLQITSWQQRSKSTSQKASDIDGMTKFNHILQISDQHKRHKELSTESNWQALIEEIRMNLDACQYVRVFNALKQIAENLFEDENKFRKIYTDNRKLQERVLRHRGGYEFLFGLGFRRKTDIKLVCDTPHVEVVAAALTTLNQTMNLFMIGNAKNEQDEELQCDDEKVECEQAKSEDDEKLNMKQDLLNLMQAIDAFGDKYKKQTLQAASAQHVALPTDAEMANGIECMHAFVQKLEDVKEYVRFLNKPDVGKYEEWDVDACMQWIASLENGRYAKYVHILKQGFISDGIKGKLLPRITGKNLREKPFEITDFSDRMDLVQHFQDLSMRCAPSLCIDLNAPREGSHTQYIDR